MFTVPTYAFVGSIGAVFNAVVLVVVFAPKVTRGAWIAVAAMIVLFLAMRAINRYYTRVTIEVAADDDELTTLPAGCMRWCWCPGCTARRCTRSRLPVACGRTSAGQIPDP